jgi:hypothetical protein
MIDTLGARARLNLFIQTIGNRLSSTWEYVEDIEAGTIFRLIAMLCIAVAVYKLSYHFVWAFPLSHIEKYSLPAKDGLYIEDAFRKTIAQMLGGLFLLAGLYFSGKTFAISREGQITDRIAKAVDQLGKTDQKAKTEGQSPNLEVRLGAIYALEKIALDSPRDHWAMIEILTSYVRKNAPPNNRPYVSGEEPANDIQAILRVLGRRKSGPKHDRRGRDVYMSLMPSRLCGAKLSRAKLRGADLERVDLQGASLWGADLRKAALVKANLKGANLKSAKMRGASFREASLENANLELADLRDANNLTPDQVLSAKGWESARFSQPLRTELGLPPESPTFFQSLAGIFGRTERSDHGKSTSTAK